jgi:hypothetical protein
MKKTLFAVLALAAVAACNKAEVVEQNPANAIAFDNVFVDNATKSVADPSITKATLEDFAVYGFVEGATLFDGVQVSKAITNSELTKSDWKYSGTQYWIAGANYNFNAVAPMTNGGWTKEDATKDATTLSFTNNGTTDLLYALATQQGKVSGNEAVAFSFRHVLSKVKFSFENGYNATNATICVKNVKIINAYNKANVVLDAASAWSGQEGTLELAFGAAVNEGADDDKTKDGVQVSNQPDAFAYNTTLESYNELLLIPGAIDGGYNVTFDVDLLVSGTVVKTYNHTAKVDFAPVAGNCYDIKAVINAENIDPENKQEPIEFTVATLPGWGDATNVEATVNNNKN